MSGRGSLIIAVALALLATTAVPASAGRAAYGSQRPVPASCEGAEQRITAKSAKRAAAAVLCLINDVRARAGARPLGTSPKLAKASLAHTRDMTKRKFFAHVGPGGPSIAQRLRRVRYRTTRIAENIGYAGNPAPVDLVNIWIRSGPHYRNMTSRGYRYAGIAVVAKAPVRNFPKRASAATITAKFGRYR